MREAVLLWIISILFIPNFAFAGELRVTEIYDGDTVNIKVTGNGAAVKARLAGIDAPVTGKGDAGEAQPFSNEAKEYLAVLILNKTVEVKEYGCVSPDVVLVEVFHQGKNINLEMLRAGMAESYWEHPQAGPDMELFQQAEQEARAAGKGMWVQESKYVSPRQWRKKEKGRPIFAIFLYGLCNRLVK